MHLFGFLYLGWSEIGILTFMLLEFLKVLNDVLQLMRLKVAMRDTFLIVGFEVRTADIMKCSIFWDITALVRWKSTDVSEEHIASIIRVEE
jgi:hypothetical protein